MNATWNTPEGHFVTALVYLCIKRDHMEGPERFLLALGVIIEEGSMHGKTRFVPCLEAT